MMWPGQEESQSGHPQVLTASYYSLRCLTYILVVRDAGFSFSWEDALQSHLRNFGGGSA
jgi:hypothetical protein